MEWKLFLSTFVLIFLAELGDKTQLAAMASAAGSRAPGTIFAGASAALVLSTLLAVLLGSAFERVIPRNVIQAMAGAIFILFGIFFLSRALLGEARAAPAPAGGGGWVAQLALQAAVHFEERIAEDYLRGAQAAEDEALRKVLHLLHDAEREHMRYLREAAALQEDRLLSNAERELLPRIQAMGLNGRSLLRQWVAQERETARFYKTLASSATLPSLQALFTRLEKEENHHAATLERLLPL
ncbi:MAG: TMEM165/GDT1 family protein [Planctomycetota bacterium]